MRKGKYEFCVFVEEHNTVKDLIKRFPHIENDEICKLLKAQGLRYHNQIPYFAKDGTIIDAHINPTVRQLKALMKAQQNGIIKERNKKINNKRKKGTKKQIISLYQNNEIEELILLNQNEEGKIEEIEYKDYCLSCHKGIEILHITLI